MDTLKPGPAPTGRDKIFDALYGALGGKPENRWAADKLTTAIDFGTLGMLTGAYDGGRELAETGRPSALAMALMPGAKVARPAVEAAETASRQGIRAFHGSPHDFDKFSLDKIGTGEGAQAYGHGLYFAESEGVARYYKDTLAGQVSSKPAAQSHAEAWAKKYGGRLEALKATEKDVAEMRDRVAKLRAEAESAKTSGQYHIWSRKSGAADTLDNHVKAHELLANPSWERVPDAPIDGRMYEVRINAEPDQFLDWDKPLSEQGEKVRGAAQTALGYKPDIFRGDEFVRALELERGGDAATGTVNRAAATAALREAGIPGIKYLDQGSRTAGEGSRNYVVFDDALIEILRKYGLLPPAAGAGLAAALQSDPAQATP